MAKFFFKTRLSSSCAMTIAASLFLYIPLPAEAGSRITELTDQAVRSALSQGGDITFAAGGTVALTNVIVITKDTTISTGGNAVLFDGGRASRLLEVRNAHVTLDGVSFANALDDGKADDSPVLCQGSAIRQLGGSVALRNCIVSNCTTIGKPAYVIPPDSNIPAFGGAIRTSDGELSVSNVTFVSNVAIGPQAFIETGVNSFGGAISAKNAKLQVDGCEFRLNRAEGGYGTMWPGGSDGGAFYLEGTPAIINGSAFIQNTSIGGKTRAGAIETNAKLEVNHTSFKGNQTTSYTDTAAGGAISSTSEFVADGILFTNNVATGGNVRPIPIAPCGSSGPWGGFGGALSCSGSSLLVNCTFTGNSAIGGSGRGPCDSVGTDRFEAGYGGAISFSGSLSANFSTFGSNRVASAGNPQIGRGNAVFATGVMVSRNSLYADHPYGTIDIPIGGWFTDGGYNFTSNSPIDFTQPTSKNGISVRFLSGADLLIPAPDSLLIDGGDPLDFPVSDALGNPRPIGSRPDVGAVENQAVLRLHAPARLGGGRLRVELENWTGHHFTVRQSVDLLNWSPVFLSQNANAVFVQVELPEPTQAMFYVAEQL